MTSARFLALAVLLAAVTDLTAARFETKFFHDEDGERLEFRQIEFVSPKRGLAVGVLHTGRDREPIALATSDGGNTWTRTRLPDEPVSMYCLDESLCWLVTTGGIYATTEGGLDWRRVKREKYLTRVWFTTPQRGWAIGARRKVLETRDGGKKWTALPVLESVNTSEARTIFHDILFLDGKKGIIAGRSERPQTEDTPIWLDSDPTDRRETPALSVVLQTEDGGETWKASTTSMFGRFSELEGNAKLEFAGAVVEFDRYFNYPSEVFRIDLRSGANERVLRMKDFAVTDILVLEDGRTLAGGYIPAGTLARTPVPGKVRVMETSAQMTIWKDIDVDYRAVGHRVALANAGAGSIWMATDQGMILKLVP